MLSVLMLSVLTLSVRFLYLPCWCLVLSMCFCLACVLFNAYYVCYCLVYVCFCLVYVFALGVFMLIVLLLNRVSVECVCSVCVLLFVYAWFVFASCA